MHGESGTPRSQRHQQPNDDHQIDQRRPTGHQHDQRAREREGGNDQPDDPAEPCRKHAVPGSHTGDEHTAQQQQPPRELTDRDRDRKRIVAAATTNATIANSRRLTPAPGIQDQPTRPTRLPLATGSAPSRCRCVVPGHLRILPEHGCAAVTP